MKNFSKILIVVLLVIALVIGYVSYKKNSVKIAVENYLETELGIEEQDIIESTPIVANLSGDKNWLVFIKLKNDPKGYYYYKHKDEIILESYTLNGVVYVQ